MAICWVSFSSAFFLLKDPASHPGARHNSCGQPSRSTGSGPSASRNHQRTKRPRRAAECNQHHQPSVLVSPLFLDKTADTAFAPAKLSCALRVGPLAAAFCRSDA
ncbi:hypothetical protein FA95DRAFT_587831 [Auriscalpium vulgare]|uniref:Uncharacterized protein n=1 Tax=Auriscalpium vulgare TaxID=40419 RepID=A0ACB8RF93_9AGAM|nr:hypothetical protein FA95DRAFT_587831 [Auriscalpium vulgare]